MPSKGQKLENPHTGDTYEFLETAADTNGNYIKVMVTLKSKGVRMPDHIHTIQDEFFEVLSCKLTVIDRGEKIIIYPGGERFFPKNRPHNHYNNHLGKVIFIQTVSPALDFDYLLETLHGLSCDGKIRKGKIGFLQQMVLLKYIESKRVLADVPLGLQNALVNALAPLGRILGYRAVYKKYSGIEK